MSRIIKIISYFRYIMASSDSEDDEQETSRAKVLAKLMIESTQQFLHILNTTAEADALKSAAEALESGLVLNCM